MSVGAAILALLSTVTPAAVTLRVPDDHPTIRDALEAARPGDVVEVADGVYHEKLVFPRGGAPGRPITLRARPGHRPVLDGTGVAGANMILVESKSHLRIVGLEIRNHRGVDDGSGIRVVGAGRDLEIRGNVIHDIRGESAMGITVYGTEPEPIRELTIDGNEIYDCEPAPSEALVLNGNVTDFAVTGNRVRDVNNIGIDLIGGETDVQPDPDLVARGGVVAGNVVMRANSDYDGGFAAGIYVDGGRDLVIENNLVTGSDLGIEIGAERPGQVTAGVVVRNNVLYLNEKAGLLFGGYARGRGRARDNAFRGNTLYKNNTLGPDGQGRYFAGNGIGEVLVQWSADNVFENNLVVAGDENVFFAAGDAGAGTLNRFDYNLYFSAGGVEDGEFSLGDDTFDGFADWRAGSGHDAHSIAADPLLADPDGGDFHLAPSSPAVDRGNPAYVPAPGETDLDGETRRAGVAVDLGADEAAASLPCSAGATTLCLAGDRFAVEVSWRDFQGGTGSGHSVDVNSDDSGIFWFFTADNWEMLVKVLDGCRVNGRYWVFAAATTNVEYTLRVTDTASGAAKSYVNPLGVAAPALTDTGAFATCARRR